MVIAFALLGEVWGLDPATGDQIWSVKTKTQAALAPCVVRNDDMLYCLGGRGAARGCAVRLGGSGDISETHVTWRSPRGPYVPTPLYANGRLYWADDGGILFCVDAATGELLYRERLGDAFYASGVRAGEAIYFVSRTEGVFVIADGPEHTLLAHNRIESDDTIFDGTPAVSNGQLFIRSNKTLYCIDD